MISSGSIYTEQGAVLTSTAALAAVKHKAKKDEEKRA